MLLIFFCSCWNQPAIDNKQKHWNKNQRFYGNNRFRLLSHNLPTCSMLRIAFEFMWIPLSLLYFRFCSIFSVYSMPAPAPAKPLCGIIRLLSLFHRCTAALQLSYGRYSKLNIILFATNVCACYSFRLQIYCGLMISLLWLAFAIIS